MRHRHTRNKYLRRPYKTKTAKGKTVIAYFENNPEEMYARAYTESPEFRSLLVKQYDYRRRGVGKDHYRRLIEIKFQWESGGMTPPGYVPSDDFMKLGKILDLSPGEVEFNHK